MDSELNQSAPAASAHETRPSGWTAVFAPIIALACPRRTAQRMHSAGRRPRVLLHVVASLFLLVVIFVIGTMNLYVGLNAQYRYGFSGGAADAPAPQRLSVVDAAASFAAQVGWELWSPRFGPLWFIIIVIGWEAGLAALALVVMPWGARDEPMRRSYRAALGGVWTQIGSAAWMVAAIGALGVTLDYMNGRFPYNPPALSWPTRPTPPLALRHARSAATRGGDTGVPVTQPIVSPYQVYDDSTDDPAVADALPDVADASPEVAAEIEAYKEALGTYKAEMAKVTALSQQYSSQYWASLPWYLRDREAVVISTGCFGAAWWVWLLLRAVGASRMVARVERPPLCEWCGYNLTTLALDARCPECGEEVSASLGLEARPGTACDTATWRMLPSAAMDCMVQAVFNPQALGRRLRMTEESRGGRRCLFFTLPAIVVIAGLALIALTLTLSRGQGDEYGLYALVSLIYGIFCATVGVGGMLLSALVAGGWIGRGVERNLLSAAMQMACYLSGWLVAWAVVGATTTYLTIVGLNEHFFRELADQTRFASESMLALITWTIPNAFMLAAYVVFLFRGTSAARYANR